MSANNSIERGTDRLNDGSNAPEPFPPSNSDVEHHFAVNGHKYRVVVYEGTGCWSSFAERNTRSGGYLGGTGARYSARAAWLAALRLVARDAL